MKLDDLPPPDDSIDEASAWCLRLVDGQLSAQERNELEQWLAEPRNAKALEEVTLTWQAIEATRLSSDLIDMRRSALESFRRAQASRWKGSSRWRGIATIAACLLVICVTAVLWLQFTPTRYATGLGERRVVVLPDGSRLSLDAQTTVKARYSSKRRELWLAQGRAKFQVARDPLRPFSVSAANKVVVATGTEFSVEILVRQVHVVLYHGAVDVLAERNGQPLQPVEVLPVPASATSAASLQPSLSPGRELIVPIETAVARIEPTDPTGSAAWEAGQLVFRDEPLALAVERMNRYTDAPLQVGDDRAGAVRISGVYAAGDTNAFIEGVTSVFPIHVREVAGRRQLFSSR